MEFEPGRRRSETARGPLAEPAGLRPCGPATDWPSTTGAWPRPGGCCKATWSTPTADVPRRVVDPLAADRRRAGRRPAAGRWPIRCWARSARLHRQTDHRQGPRRRFQLRLARNGRGLAAARARWNCCAAPRKIELGGMLLDLLPQDARWSRCGRRSLWALGRIGARQPRLRAAEHRRAGRRGCRTGCAKLMDFAGDDPMVPAGRDADGPADRRPLPRPARQAPRQGARLARPARGPGAFPPTGRDGGPSTARSRAWSSAKRCPRGSYDLIGFTCATASQKQCRHRGRIHCFCEAVAHGEYTTRGHTGTPRTATAPPGRRPRPRGASASAESCCPRPGCARRGRTRGWCAARRSATDRS